MRKPAAAPVAARQTLWPAGNAVDTPVELVCLALALALVVLVWRIASIW
jgi:hypothetical protein